MTWTHGNRRPKHPSHGRPDLPARYGGPREQTPIGGVAKTTERDNLIASPRDAYVMEGPGDRAARTADRRSRALSGDASRAGGTFEPDQGPAGRPRADLRPAEQRSFGSEPLRAPTPGASCRADRANRQGRPAVNLDCVIVGGSPGGLTAAIYLAATCATSSCSTTGAASERMRLMIRRRSAMIDPNGTVTAGAGRGGGQPG